MVISADISILL